MRFITSFFILFLFISCSSDYNLNLGKGWYITENNIAIFDRELNENDSIVWIGKSRKGKANGDGKLIKYRNDIILYEYDGSVKNGIISGQGKKTLLNGNVYEGEFQHDLNGFGSIKYVDGFEIKGLFINDLSNQPFLMDGFISDPANDSIWYFKNGKEIEYDTAIEQNIILSKNNEINVKKLKSPELNKKINLYYDADFNIVEDQNQAIYYSILEFVSENQLKDNREMIFDITGELFKEVYYSFFDLNHPLRSLKNGKSLIYEDEEVVDSTSYFHGKILFNSRLEVNQLALEFPNTYKDENLYNTKTYYYDGKGNQKTKKYYYREGKLKYFEILDENEMLIPGLHYYYLSDGSAYRSYFENFSMKETKWIKGDSIFTLGEKNNLIVKTKERVKKIVPINYDNKNPYDISISFTKEAGKNLDGSGIVFNYMDDDNFDQFLFSSDGYFRIDRKTNGKNYPYGSWIRSDFINKSNGKNVLSISFYKKRVFKINGNAVYSTNYLYASDDFKKGLHNNFGILIDQGTYSIDRFHFVEYFSSLQPEPEPEHEPVVSVKEVDTSSDPEKELQKLKKLQEEAIAKNKLNKLKEEKRKIENEKKIKRDWTGSGTGIILTRDGLMATNYHVIKDAQYIEVEIKENNGDIKSYNAQVVKADAKNDLALIKITDDSFKKLGRIKYNFDSNLAKTASSVYALGYPYALNFNNLTREGLMGREIKFTDGKISSRTGIAGNPIYYQTTVPIQPGNSGGPLFDSDANLIGINVGFLDNSKYNDVSYSIKTSILKNMIDVYDEDLDLPNYIRTGNKSLEEQVEVLEKYVTLIKTAKN